MAHDIFCEKSNGCCLGQQQMLFGAFSFFMKRAPDAFFFFFFFFFFCGGGGGGGGVGHSHSVPVRRGRCLDLPERLKIPERL